MSGNTALKGRESSSKALSVSRGGGEEEPRRGRTIHAHRSQEEYSTLSRGKIEQEKKQQMEKGGSIHGKGIRSPSLGKIKRSISSILGGQPPLPKKLN